MKIFTVLLIACCCFGIWLTTKASHIRLPDEFTVDKIVQDRENGVVSSCPLELLQQNFSYLGHGTQSIAFVGEDQKTVLKCFLQKKINGDKKYRFVSFRDVFFRKEKMRKRQLHKEKDLQFAFERYANAFQFLKEETGLLAIHLSATRGIYPTCQITDFQGKKWILDLDRASFVLQRRAIPLGQVFTPDKTEVEKQLFFQEMDRLLEARACKGFFDLGQGRIFDANYGFIGNQAILFDVGHLGYSDEVRMHPEAEIKKMQKRLRERFFCKKIP